MSSHKNIFKFIICGTDTDIGKTLISSFFVKGLDSLNKTLDRKPILIKLAQQGHCLNNLNLYEILLNTLNDENG